MDCREAKLTKLSALPSVCKMSYRNRYSGYSIHNEDDGKPSLSDRIRQIYLDDPPVYRANASCAC